MSRIAIGDCIKHRQSDAYVFQVIDEWTTIPPGGASLYHCKIVLPLPPPSSWLTPDDIEKLINQEDEEKIYKYSEGDIFKVDSPEAEEGAE